MIKQENYFYVCNGSVLKDKYELLEFLKNCDDSTFSNHVNLEKNDFANWIRDIFKDQKLSNKMYQTIKKEQTIHLLEESMKHKENQRKDRKSVINKLVQVIKNG